MLRGVGSDAGRVLDRLRVAARLDLRAASNWALFFGDAGADAGTVIGRRPGAGPRGRRVAKNDRQSHSRNARLARHYRADERHGAKAGDDYPS